MAHEISILEDGTAEAAFVNTPAWHGLGTVLAEAPDSATMLQAAHLDWKVGFEPLQTASGIKIPGQFATVRDDLKTVLGIVSEKYKIVQNFEAFDFVDSLLQDGVMKYEAAGALQGGRIVWVLGRMPTIDRIAKGDDCLRYVLFTTSHDGSANLHAIPTSVRVVCANTRRIALGNDVGVRHMGNMQGKLDFLRKNLSQYDQAFTLFRDQAKRLADKEVTNEEAKAYILELFPESETEKGATRRLNCLRQIASNLKSPTCTVPGSGIKGSWWSLYCGVDEFFNHQASFKGRDDRDRAENRMISVTNGRNADLNDRAFELALVGAGL